MWMVPVNDVRFRVISGWPFEYSWADRSAATSWRRSSSVSGMRGAWLIGSPGDAPSRAGAGEVGADGGADPTGSGGHRLLEDVEGVRRADPRERRGRGAAQCGRPSRRPPLAAIQRLFQRGDARGILQRAQDFDRAQVDRSERARVIDPPQDMPEE